MRVLRSLISFDTKLQPILLTFQQIVRISAIAYELCKTYFRFQLNKNVIITFHMLPRKILLFQPSTLRLIYIIYIHTYTCLVLYYLRYGIYERRSIGAQTVYETEPFLI